MPQLSIRKNIFYFFKKNSEGKKCFFAMSMPMPIPMTILTRDADAEISKWPNNNYKGFMTTGKQSITYRNTAKNLSITLPMRRY